MKGVSPVRVMPKGGKMRITINQIREMEEKDKNIERFRDKYGTGK